MSQQRRSPRAKGYDDAVGWVSLPGLVTPAEIDDVLAACRELLELPSNERRTGDKVASGTRHLVELDARSELVAEIANRNRLVTTVGEILGTTFRREQVGYRSPQPSFGEQKLHADDTPKLDPGPNMMATAIVALTDFTNENGATRLVPGSHRRPDLQRSAGKLTDHPDQITLTGTAGTVFLFSGHILHSGTRNRSEHERPALQIIWRT